MEIMFNKLSFIENKGSSLERTCLSEVNMIINEGSIVGIVGERLDFIGELIMLIKRPSKGEIQLGQTIIKRNSHIANINEIRSKIGFIKSDDVLFVNKTVKDEIKYVMKNYDYKAKNVTKHIVDSLKIAGLNEDYLERDPATLSYTEKKRLKLACVMSYNPEVLILEGFEKGFTFRDREYFRKLFLKLRGKFNKTIILLSSDLTFLFDIVNIVHVINRGKVVLSNDKKIFYEDKLYKYVEMPKIVKFTKCAKDVGHNILEYTDIKELIKELYRNVK